MKSKANAYWIISGIFLALAALWGAVTELKNVMGAGTVSGIALIVFGVISTLAAFTYGVRANGSGWLLMEGIISFCMGLAYIFTYVDYALFTVDLVYIMGLWLMFLGVSQVSRMSKKSKGFGRVIAVIMGVVCVLSGLALYIRPVAELMQFSAGGYLQVYSTTFQFLIASLTVVSRLLLKDSKK